MIEWHFPRARLAQQYMNAFDTGITGALAIFAPRRMGKTEFVLMDLAPEAEARGYKVGYCSFWNLQDNPAKSLRLALDAIHEKGEWRKKWLSTLGATTTEVSASLAGAAVKIKSPDVKARTEENDLLAIIGSISKLTRQRRPLLLLLDEVQHLANDTHATLVATMRTQFDEHKTKIRVVYTGSSRDGLQRMFRDRKAPMFHAAQEVDFPRLESDFVAFMLGAFEKACQRKLSLAMATRIFVRMNHNPALFHHLLRHMVIQGLWDVEKGYEHFLTLIDVDADCAALWAHCKPVDRALLALLAQMPDLAIYSDETRVRIGEEVGTDSISVKVMQNSIERLRLNQIIYSPTRGEWVFEDQSFKSWILSKSND